MKKVLIVDDIKGIQMLLSKCLEIEGFSTSVCGNGREALDILLREKFDLVFLDIKLPVVSGTEVLKKIRASDITTPVIVITAHGNIKNAIECTRLGAAAYVQKPFTVNRILALLNDLDIHGDAHSSALISDARVMFEQHRYEEVEKFLKSMVSSDMLNPEIYRMLAEVSRKLNKDREYEQFSKLYQSLKE